MINCSCCNSAMISGLSDWHFCCPVCGYESTTLEPSVNDASKSENINESAREQALMELRLANFETVIEMIAASRSDISKDSLLDVGAAHGWFVLRARELFARVASIEPDRAVAEIALKNGVSHRIGYFPEILSRDEVFDVIVFNDVFEHIPELDRIIKACRDHLSSSGLLILNLPMSSGIFYRLASILMRVGLRGPFERMWQKGLPSPHVHYFNEKNLKELLYDKGFSLDKVVALPSIRLRRLYSRVSLMRQQSLLANVLIYLVLVMLYPFLIVMPSDTKAFTFIKKQL